MILSSQPSRDQMNSSPKVKIAEFSNESPKSPKQELLLSDIQFTQLLHKNSYHPSFISQQIVYNYSVFEQKHRTYTRDEWKKISLSTQKSLISYSELEFNLRNGIPDDIRPRLWFWLTDMPKLERRFKGQYQKLKSSPSNSDDQINKDITRTYSTHSFFSSDRLDMTVSSNNSSDFQSPQLSKNSSTQSNGTSSLSSSRNQNNTNGRDSATSCLAKSKGQQMLFNILRAYANLDQEIGYVQGMNMLAAHIILSIRPEKYTNFARSFGNKCTEQQVEERAFLIFCHIMIDKNWRQTYLPGFVRLYCLIESLEKQFSPEIAEHFKDVKLEILPTFQQFYLTFLLKDSSTDFARRFIDLFLHRGELLIEQIILRMLDIFQTDILNIKDPFKLQMFIAQEMLKNAIKMHKNDFSIILPLSSSHTEHI